MANKFAKKGGSMTTARLQEMKKTKGTIISIKNAELAESKYNKDLDMSGVDELAASMKKNGFIGAIEVFPADPDGKYEINAGHRRRAAWCGVLGHEDIPATVIDRPSSAVGVFALHYDSNALTREKTPAFYLAEIKNLQEALEEDGFSGSRKEFVENLANGLHMSSDHVYRYLAFDKMTEKMKALTNTGLSIFTISLAGGLDEEKQDALADRVNLLYDSDETYEMSRREFLALIAKSKKAKAAKPKAKPAKPPYQSSLERSATSFKKLLDKATPISANITTKKLAVDAINDMLTDLKSIKTMIQATLREE